MDEQENNKPPASKEERSISLLFARFVNPVVARFDGRSFTDYSISYISESLPAPTYSIGDVV